MKERGDVTSIHFKRKLVKVIIELLVLHNYFVLFWQAYLTI